MYIAKILGKAIQKTSNYYDKIKTEHIHNEYENLNAEDSTIDDESNYMKYDCIKKEWINQWNLLYSIIIVILIYFLYNINLNLSKKCDHDDAHHPNKNETIFNIPEQPIPNHSLFWFIIFLYVTFFLFVLYHCLMRHRHSRTSSNGKDDSERKKMTNPYTDSIDKYVPSLRMNSLTQDQWKPSKSRYVAIDTINEDKIVSPFKKPPSVIVDLPSVVTNVKTLPMCYLTSSSENNIFKPIKSNSKK